MKKRTVYLKVFTALLVITTVFYLNSCTKESQSTHQEKALNEKKEITPGQSLSRAGCEKPICFREIDCVGTFCSVGRTYCYPSIPCFDF